LWIEFAAWFRNLDGWKVERTGSWPVGFRVWTPLVNMALSIDWRREVG